MAARDRLADLPPELARHIFSFFDYMELRPVLSTCRSWRHIAIDCPAYWLTVNLDTPTEGQAQTFLSRLRGAKGRRCRIDIYTARPWATLSSVILPEIASMIGNIYSLSITAHIAQMDHVFQTLDSPAPELQDICIRFTLDSTDTALALLPRSLLQGQAAVLKTVFLMNVDIPDPPPDVFASVTIVYYGYNLPKTETKALPDLWSIFPKMRTLSVMNNALLGDILRSEKSCATLEWLNLYQNIPALLHAFGSSATAIGHVRNIQLSRPARHAIDQMLGHVSREMQVALHIPSTGPTIVEVVFGDTAWQRSRVFATLLSDWLDPTTRACDLLSRFDVVERVVSLTLPAVLWPPATRTMLPMTHLTELRLVLDVESPVAFSQLGPLGNIVCPVLKALVLRVEEGGYCVTLEQVRAFTSVGLHDWRAPLELRFEDVTLVGYGRVVPDDQTFTYCWKSKKQWDYPDADWNQ